MNKWLITVVFRYKEGKKVHIDTFYVKIVASVCNCQRGRGELSTPRFYLPSSLRSLEIALCHGKARHTRPAEMVTIVRSMRALVSCEAHRCTILKDGEINRPNTRGYGPKIRYAY